MFPPQVRGNAAALILPIPFERTVSYGTGTSLGPRAIIDASPQIELFEEETLVDFAESPRLHTLPPLLDYGTLDVPGYLESIQETIRPRRGKFLLGLGGEHTVTYGTVRGLTDALDQLTIVQLDAHADMAADLHGAYWSHGSVMRRLWEHGPRFVQIGIRSLSRAEYDLVSSGDRITTFFAHDLSERWSVVLDTLRNLEGPVFLTLDVDGLDPSVIPSTGTPQPNGLTWRQTMEIVKTLAHAPRIQWIGADIVEFVPSPHPPGCDLTAARLAMKILAFWHVGRNART